MKNDPCWNGYEMIGTKEKDGKKVPNCVPVNKENLNEYTIEEKEELIEFLKYLIDQKKQFLPEAEYRGRKVTLNKPMRGDVKKFKAFVRDKKTGNVKKVNFGDPNMRIKKSDPVRRKSFRARHKCDTAKDKTTPRYWSCRMWQ